MLNEDELGESLRTAMHALVDGIEPSEELVRKLSDRHRRPTSAGSWKRFGRGLRPRTLVATVVVLGAILAGALIELGGSAVSASYAVTLGSDGAVKITLYQLSGAPGANARLKALGVRAVIVPIRPGCKTKLDLTYIGVAIRPAGRFRLHANQIPAGTTIVLAAKQIAANVMEEAIGRTTGGPPSCVAPGTSGPGIGRFTPSSRASTSTGASGGK